MTQNEIPQQGRGGRIDNNYTLWDINYERVDCKHINIVFLWFNEQTNKHTTQLLCRILLLLLLLLLACKIGTQKRVVTFISYQDRHNYRFFHQQAAAGQQQQNQEYFHNESVYLPTHTHTRSILYTKGVVTKFLFLKDYLSLLRTHTV